MEITFKLILIGVIAFYTLEPQVDLDAHSETTKTKFWLQNDANV